ncbi:MAG: sigma-70 family RNA polymerase sigma factor [Christensenellales bacterium]
MEDWNLITMAKKGDLQALNMLMTNYKKLVNKIARKYFIIGADLNDVIQEGMIGLFNAYSNFDTKKNVKFKTFATLCINRQIISAIKKAYKHANNDLIDDINLNEIYSNDKIISPEDDFIESESFKNLKNEIKQKLSNLEIKILNEFLQNSSYEEISSKLNISKKSVDNALSRIRNKLNYLNKI